MLLIGSLKIGLYALLAKSHEQKGYETKIDIVWTTAYD
jgi:hypothetical protein